MELKKCLDCELNYVTDGGDYCALCKTKHEKCRFEPEPEMEIDNNEMQDRNKLLNVLNEYGFKGFFHTTNFDNFVNIYKSNVLGSRKYVLDNKINFVDNADKDVLEHTEQNIFEYVRFYYREKTPTNYSAFHGHSQKSPVIMLFNKNIIFHKGVRFCDGNAGSFYSWIVRKAEFALKFKWDRIFSDDNDYSDISKIRKNAEFLYSDHISLDYVDKFYFRNYDDYAKAIELFGKNEKFELRKDLFF